MNLIKWSGAEVAPLFKLLKIAQKTKKNLDKCAKIYILQPDSSAMKINPLVKLGNVPVQTGTIAACFGILRMAVAATLWPIMRLTMA